jgi:DNA modification methylase
VHEVLLGDCLEVMKTFPDNYFSAVVTDPPYGLSFMGKGWDHAVPEVSYWKEALRISKPASFLISMGGTRTFHRLACAIEDAGWEIRDCISWLYGSGFPKSHNHFGIDGYGTALKPAWEPCIMAMKPLDGTFAQNVQKWGQAGINIDGCRIRFSSEKEKQRHAQEWNRNWTNSPIHAFDKETGNHPGQKREIGEGSKPQKGRWPANVILDEEAGRMLDEQSGVSASKMTKRGELADIRGNRYNIGDSKTISNSDYIRGHNDSGGASRFFYCAKASRAERSEGLPQSQRSTHPTVKPLKLMEYLIKLVMPPSGGILLDPFVGSGSTLVAAKRLGFSAVGIEKQAEYVEIAKARIEITVFRKESDQMDLFDENEHLQ